MTAMITMIPMAVPECTLITEYSVFLSIEISLCTADLLSPFSLVSLEVLEPMFDGGVRGLSDFLLVSLSTV